MKFTRENLLETIKMFMDLPDVKVVPGVPEGAIMVVTRVEDFEAASNDLWHLAANKSYPREGVVCGECGFAVVMSDGAFKTCSERGMTNRIICNRCFLKTI